MKAVDFTPFEEDIQGAYGPAPNPRGEPDFRDQVRRVDELIDSRSVPTPAGQNRETPKRSQGKLNLRHPSQTKPHIDQSIQTTDTSHPPLMIGMIRPPNLMMN